MFVQPHAWEADQPHHQDYAAGGGGDCAPGCPWSSIGNGACDTGCDVPECSHDMGDCDSPHDEMAAHADAAAGMGDWPWADHWGARCEGEPFWSMEGFHIGPEACRHECEMREECAYAEFRALDQSDPSPKNTKARNMGPAPVISTSIALSPRHVHNLHMLDVCIFAHACSATT